MTKKRKRKVNEDHVQPHKRQLTKLSHTAHVAINTATSQTHSTCPLLRPSKVR
jgi:hypothetical protein